MPITVLALGGSLIAPDGVDTAFVRHFADTVTDFLRESQDHQLVVVAGGGSLARSYQKWYREIAPGRNAESQDWIGIAATKVNAELLRQVLGNLAPGPVVLDPKKPGPFAGKVMVAAGWQPGCSTDYVAVLLARQVQAPRLISMSNIDMIYTADPGLDPDARPLTSMRWSKLAQMVGEKWRPGAHTPFDPSATRLAREIRLTLVATGSDCQNLSRVLAGADFQGTTVGPD